jgi:hypothetical protein
MFLAPSGAAYPDERFLEDVAPDGALVLAEWKATEMPLLRR